VTIQEVLKNPVFIDYLEEAKYAEGWSPTLFITIPASEEKVLISLNGPEGEHPGETAIGGAVDLCVSQGMQVVVAHEIWVITRRNNTLSLPSPSQSPDRRQGSSLRVARRKDGRSRASPCDISARQKHD
jgi:hypothetical protein